MTDAGAGQRVVDAYLETHPNSRLYLRQEAPDSLWPGAWIGTLYTDGESVCGALGHTQLEAIQGIASELSMLAQPPDRGAVE